MNKKSDEQPVPFLRDLKSLIAHAQEIEQEIEVVARSLMEQQVESGIYQLVADIAVNLEHLQEIFSGSDDAVFREVQIASLENRRAILVYVHNMSNQHIINEHIIEKLTASHHKIVAGSSNQEVLHYLKSKLLTAAAITESTAMEEAVKRILLGDTLLIIDGVPSALLIATREVAIRAIANPETEADVRGPREGFTEDLRTGITLVRRRLNNPNLVVKNHVVGSRSRTEVAVLYFKGIVNFKLVCEVERRLQKLNIDAPQNLGIQKLIEDHPHSPFPTIVATERPDKFAAALLKGKVGIIVDGTPFALLAPAILSDFMAAGDDYHEKWLPATALRLLRYLAGLVALTVPALYVAITTFHPALLPAPLALTIGISREGVPFPSFVEAVLMIVALEVMQEAGIRMPKNVGQAVSIVGGLVLGDSAVRAGIVSASLVIVNSLTAIATFSIANYRLVLAVRILRFPLMIAGAAFGMYGVMIGLLIIVVHLSLLESFGEPYLATQVPRNLVNLQDMKDAMIVAPPAAMDYRPTYLEAEDSRRQKP
ncbi:MAG: spore germination protein [Negativicutes bacterium]|nr:spore germination protein [Negativicutes bacterium]